MEIWKEIKGYEGIYEVSNLGNVKSLSRIVLKCGKNPFNTKELILKPGLSRGYFKVILYNNGNQKARTVHQLVAESFLNHKPNGHELVINHINFDRTDNRIENLEIVTQRENANKKHLKSSSSFTGVSWYKPSNKWMAYIAINGKRKHLGYFTTEFEASNAYQNELLIINN